MRNGFLLIIWKIQNQFNVVLGVSSNKFFHWVLISSRDFPPRKKRDKKANGRRVPPTPSPQPRAVTDSIIKFLPCLSSEKYQRSKIQIQYSYNCSNKYTSRVNRPMYSDVGLWQNQSPSSQTLSVIFLQAARKTLNEQWGRVQSRFGCLTWLFSTVMCLWWWLQSSSHWGTPCSARPKKTFRHCEVLAGWHCEVEHPALLCSSSLRLNTEV